VSYHVFTLSCFGIIDMDIDMDMDMHRSLHYLERVLAGLTVVQM